MSYLVLSRKYRPQIFEDVIGQNHVTQTLQNALSSDRMSHAYILTGPRGVGKTTTARILAKALNCLEGEKSEPCGQCDICVEITEGRSFDVLEIDGATYRGLDKIRDDLQDYLRHPPLKSEYKVVIIDEVHMLTREAFNSLLKTLEEPPPNVVFIFATTQPNKVPPTILSRCQRFDFRRIPSSVIIESIRILTDKEKIKIDEDSLKLIARKADGGMRDALSLLDQAISFSDGDIEYTNLRSVMGIIDDEIYFSITDLAMTGNSSAAMALANELIEEGYDPQTLVAGLMEHLRSLLITKATGSAELLETTQAIKDLFLSKMEKVSESEILRLLKMTQDTSLSISRSSMPGTIFELLLLNITNMDKSIDIQSVLKEIGYSGEIENNNQQKEESAASTANQNEKVEPESEKNESILVKNETVKEEKPEVASSDNDTKDTDNSFSNLETFVDEWKTIVNEITEKRSNLGSSLRKAIPTVINGNYVELSFDTSNAYEKGSVEHNSKYIRDFIKAKTGRDLSIKTTLGDFATPEDIEDTSSKDESVNDDNDFLKHPTVEKIIEKFNGKLTI